MTNTRKQNPSMPQKETSTKPSTPIKEPKDVVCFKYNGRGHYKKDCPNPRAFTMTEWGEIRQDTRAKVILVSKNGKEEEVWPQTSKEDPNGTYMVGDDGTLQEFVGEESDLGGGET